VVDISHPNYEEQLGVVNKTLQELEAFDKPIITIFNKMDLYIKNTFDEWLDEETKNGILEDLKARWQGETNNNAIFISALERTNIEELRNTILEKVREHYRIRYPYKTDFFY
jgi:GTP-binding protein HflX